MTTLTVRDDKEVRKRTKQFMTSLINGALQCRQIVSPIEELEIEDQYTKGNDHIIDACAARCCCGSRPTSIRLARRRCRWCR